MVQEIETTAPAGMEIVSKSAALLGALAHHGELSVTGIADRIHEPVSSVYRMLSSLEALGWIDRGSGRGKIRVGLEFVRLGHRLEEQLDVRRLAIPELRTLTSDTRQTAFLCIRRDERAVCVERIDGADVQIQRLRLGESLPLGEGAAPRAILAFEPSAVIERYLEGMPSGQRVDLRTQLDGIRFSGVSVAHEDGINGIGSIGAPVFDHRGLVVAGLSISGLRQNVFDQQLNATHMVAAAASRVSASLGYRAKAIE